MGGWKLSYHMENYLMFFQIYIFLSKGYYGHILEYYKNISFAEASRDPFCFPATARGLWKF